MSVYEINLMGSLAREVGDTDQTNPYYSSDEIFSALNDGLKDYNLEMPQQYSVISSGDSAYYSPDPGEAEQRLIILYSARVLLKGELAKQARQAIIHTNPTGRTDLSQRPKWTLEALREKNKEINRLKQEIYSKAMNAVSSTNKQVDSMELKNSTTSTGVEGLPITTVITSK